MTLATVPQTAALSFFVPGKPQTAGSRALGAVERAFEMLFSDPGTNPHILAREIVCEYGWWTTRWPIVRRNLPRSACWAVNLAVTAALGRGVIRGLLK